MTLDPITDEAHLHVAAEVAGGLEVDPDVGLSSEEASQRLTGAQWLVVPGLSLITPAFIGIDRAVQQRQATPEPAAVGTATEATPASGR